MGMSATLDAEDASMPLGCLGRQLSLVDLPATHACTAHYACNVVNVQISTGW